MDEHEHDEHDAAHEHHDAAHEHEVGHDEQDGAHEHEVGHDEKDGAHEHEHSPIDYATWVTQQRQGKDAYFRDSRQSPIPSAERAAFDGLPYFPVDLAFRFEGVRLQPLDTGLDVEVQVQTSDGAQRDGSRVGALVFEVGGQEQRLTAL